MRALCRLWLLWLCVPLTAMATGPVGTAEVVEAQARVARGGATEQPLRKGGAISLGDTVRVVKGNVKLRLTDGSVLLLSEGAELKVTEADFGALGRKAFSAELLLGSVWARVKRAAAGSERNFEIRTERAVAGVRGTEFRVDVRSLDGERFTRVSVFQGAVYVRGEIKAPQLSVAMDTDRLSSPDAVRSAKRGPPPPPAPPSAPAAAAPPARVRAAPAELEEEAQQPPTRERVLELNAREAVVVGPDDDWQPEPTSDHKDRLGEFAAKHLK